MAVIEVEYAFKCVLFGCNRSRGSNSLWACVAIRLLCTLNLLLITPIISSSSSSSSFLRSAAQADLLVQSLCAVIFSYDPVGMGIPYASSVGPDKKESVVDLAVQVLLSVPILSL